MIKIAMLDDNKTILSVNTMVLKKEEAIIDEDILHTYLTPEDFLAKINGEYINKYDIVIIDHNLGIDKIKGLNIIIRMKRNGFIGKAVLLTSNNSIEMSFKTGNLCDVDYIIKNEKNTLDLLINAINTTRFKKNQYETEKNCDETQK